MRKTNQLIILLVAVCAIMNVNAQKPFSLFNYDKHNLKTTESYKSNRTTKEIGTDILRADYHVNYKNKNYTSPVGIALDFLKSKSTELGISADLKNIRIRNTFQSPACTYVYLEQHVNNIPVFFTSSIVVIKNDGTVTALSNGFRQMDAINKLSLKPVITAENALHKASIYLNLEKEPQNPPKTELMLFESKDRGMELAWKVNSSTLQPLGDWRLFVNAVDGRIIHVDDIANYSYEDGQGKVFDPSPTKYTNHYNGDTGFIDNNDFTSSQLNAARVTVILQDITKENGVYKLKGPYCVVENRELPDLPIPEESLI